MVNQLNALANVATELDLPSVRDETAGLASRVSAGQFYVACVGQFKRGKSTLINALLEDPVLPVGIIPVTMVPTVVRHGPTRLARVRLDDATASPGAPSWRTVAIEDLPRYVSEEYNHANQKRVRAVEVFVPSPLLAAGMCLVDTPGLGSVFEDNSAATRAFIPHIDAAIVVIGADPPLSGEELDLIAAVAREVTDLVVVLNKADRVTEGERAVAESFARTVVGARIDRPIGRIFEVSATERLARAGPHRDWNELLAVLAALMERSGHQLVRAAGRRGVARIANRLLAAVREERAALVRPAHDAEDRIRTLDAMVQDGGRALSDLAPLFAAEQQRLSRRFAAERAEFLGEALPRARAMLATALGSIRGLFGPRLRRAMMHASQSVTHQVLDPWFAVQQEHASLAFRESMVRFATLADSLLDQLARNGMPEVAYGRIDGEVGVALRTPSAFVFKDVIHVAEPASPLRFIADLGLGLFARGVFVGDAEAFLDWLLEMNSSRVQSDVDRRIAESRRGLEADVRKLLDEVSASAQRALERANATRADGVPAMEAALARLDRIEAELRGIVEDEPAESNS